MSNRLAEKAEHNALLLGRNTLLKFKSLGIDLKGLEEARGLDPEIYVEDALDKWSEKDTLAFRLLAIVRAAPPIGQIAIDFSYSKPTIAWLKASGYKYVIGYTSQRADKNLTRTYCEDLLAAGIKIMFVSQDGAQDPLYGYPRGRLRAEQAAYALDRIGYPTWCPLPYATDFDASLPQLRGPVSEFYKGVEDMSVQTRREWGSYGSFRTTEEIVRINKVKWPWQCVAWSGGQISKHAMMLQYPGRRFYFPSGYSSYDENTIFNLNIPWWGNPAPVKPDSPQQRWGKYAVPMVGGFWAEEKGNH